MEPPRQFDLALIILCGNIEKHDKDQVKIVFEPLHQRIVDKVFQRTKNHYLTCDGRENHNDKLFALLPCLISSKLCTKLNFHDLLMNCKGSYLPHTHFEKFLLSLGSVSPNLKELKICRRSTFENTLSKYELASIIRLKSLANLDFNDICVPLSGILLISRGCENLKKITASQVMVDVDLLRDSFRDDFVYVCIETLNRYPGQINLRMDTTLPAPDPKYAAGTQCVKMILSPTRIQDFLLTQRFAEKLNEITFDTYKLGNNEEMAKFPHLPEIKYATVNCGGKSTHTLKWFLKRNGESLQELTLRGIGIMEKMRLGVIFILCPNLQSLELSACTLFGNGAPVDDMQQLKRFKWVNDAATARAHVAGPCLDAFAFSSILSAPLLEELHISLPKIDFSDNATVISRIRRRKILRHLKKLYMPMRLGNASEIPHENPSNYSKRFKELKKALVSAIDRLDERTVFKASNRRRYCIVS
ncbi:Hypothetical predicted protein [Cloeon dipterum]|uniref:Uncharacterized protein n=1 Tax=Cloeon dipterum TaxID=197152 RepID=A0A8S1DLT0_9INSE|nr:Hypothetical predicted protein [Cloeon dipterum]